MIWGGYTGSLLKKYYFEGLLWKTVWNGLYKRELVLKVKFPKRLCFEDNYSAGMYLFYRRPVSGLFVIGEKRVEPGRGGRLLQ